MDTYFTTAHPTDNWRLFYIQHANTPARLKQALERSPSPDPDELYELLHALKGSASMLKLEPLTSFVSAACLQLRNLNTATEIPPRIDAVVTALEECLHQLSAQFDEAEELPFKQLLQLIRQHNFSALSLARELHQRNHDKKLEPAFAELISCLDRFDFQSAERYVISYLSQPSHEEVGNVGGVSLAP